MELTIGLRLREKRLERGLTQEEVAAQLGVSYQAVSKWERQEGLPDVTLLPALARLFRTTADDLLGVHDAAAQAAYDQINQTWQEQNQAGQHADNIVLMRQALRQYPGDALLLVQLSTSLEKAEGTESEQREHLLESIRVQEDILRLGGDAEIITAVQFNLCFSLWKAGQTQQAIKRAKRLPSLWKTRENALVYFVSSEEQRQLAEAALRPLAWSAALHLKTLGRHDDILPLLHLLLGEQNDDLTQRIQHMAEKTE